MKNTLFTDTVLVSGHRGERAHGMENTMAAFRRVLQAGVDMIETDVRMCADGQLVLMHDETVDRTTDGTGLVKDMTLAQMQALDAAAHATLPVGRQPPPALRQLLELVQDHPRVLLNVEFKDYPTPGNEQFAYTCADRICDMLLAFGVQDRTWINSFSGRILEHVYDRHGGAFRYHGFYPWFILGPMERDPETFIDLACMQHRVQHPDGTIEKCSDNMCPRPWFDHLLAKGIMPLMAPSLQEYPLYDLAFSYGSRVVNTDYPEDMLAHLRERGLHP